MKKKIYMKDNLLKSPLLFQEKIKNLLFGNAHRGLIHLIINRILIYYGEVLE